MKLVLLLLIISSIFASEKSKIDGKTLYLKLGCYGCHGSDAKGGLTFPRLANQSKSYLIKKLKLYRAGKIVANRALMMKPYAKKLTDEQIDAISEYLSNMPKTKEKRFYHEFEVGDSVGS